MSIRETAISAVWWLVCQPEQLDPRKSGSQAPVGCSRTDVLVKLTSDHCKTVEFPMKACGKEDAKVVASEPQKETVI